MVHTTLFEDRTSASGRPPTETGAFAPALGNLSALSMRASSAQVHPSAGLDANFNFDIRVECLQTDGSLPSIAAGQTPRRTACRFLQALPRKRLSDAALSFGAGKQVGHHIEVAAEYEPPAQVHHSIFLKGRSARLEQLSCVISWQLTVIGSRRAPDLKRELESILQSVEVAPAPVILTPPKLKAAPIVGDPTVTDPADTGCVQLTEPGTSIAGRELNCAPCCRSFSVLGDGPRLACPQTSGLALDRRVRAIKRCSRVGA